MRIIISLIIATGFVATSSLARAEAVSAEPAKIATPASPAAQDKPVEAAAKPAIEEQAVAPAESGLDQQLCVQK